jgi:hypothetical protein
MKLKGKFGVNTDIDMNYTGVPEHFYPLNLTLSELRKLFVFLPQVLDFSCHRDDTWAQTGW